MSHYQSEEEEILGVVKATVEETVEEAIQEAIQKKPHACNKPKKL